MSASDEAPKITVDLPGISPTGMDEVEQSLYAKREKIYPREVHGWYARMRTLAALALLGLFYGVVWLRCDGQQCVLFDLPERKFHVFGLIIFPQDFLYLTGLLFMAALALFLFTALAGRLWCGYACPQTVYTEVFLWIERKLEGDRPKQMRLDKAPWGARKLSIKGAKHAIWLFFSLVTGLTFVGYFTPIDELIASFFQFRLGPWEAFWVLFYSFATYGNAGWMREQVCIYMCPYARFQSAMFDKDTLVISYDAARGESRGSRRRSVDHRAAGLGDCIDCTMCVQVCPTGIDIRDGLQYQCIACASCADVCDDVMDRMGYPKGLIRYTTENLMAGKTGRIARPRIFVYIGILVAVLGVFTISLVSRVPLEADVIPDRNALFREVDQGLVENVYTLHLINKDAASHQYVVNVHENARFVIVEPNAPVTVEGATVASAVLRLRAAPGDLTEASTRVELEVSAVDVPDHRYVVSTRFLGPAVR